MILTGLNKLAPVLIGFKIYDFLSIYNLDKY